MRNTMPPDVQRSRMGERGVEGGEEKGEREGEWRGREGKGKGFARPMSNCFLRAY